MSKNNVKCQNSKMDDENEVIHDEEYWFKKAKETQRYLERCTIYMDMLYYIRQKEQIEDKDYETVERILTDVYAIAYKKGALNLYEIKNDLDYSRSIIKNNKEGKQELNPLSSKKMHKFVEDTIGAIRFFKRDLQDQEDYHDTFTIDRKTIMTILGVILMGIVMFFRAKHVI